MYNIVDKLAEKSKEAFCMALEIYNKPTIKYRVEGFSFFICNAWELMLKAHISKTKGLSEIYYPNNPSRTISLENCVRMVFTNDKSPIRLNLEKIIDLRNTSTHFVTEEYEMVYVPLFQACVFNFVDKISEFHKVNMEFEEIKKDPENIIVNIKRLIKKQANPRGKGILSTCLLPFGNPALILHELTCL